jgi:hypothetical protein
MIISAQKFKYSEVFKDDSGLINEDDALNLDRRESENTHNPVIDENAANNNNISSPINERKENKLKNLLENSVKEQKKEKGLFYFNEEEFPEISEDNTHINTDNYLTQNSENKKMTLRKNSENNYNHEDFDNEDQPDYFDNLPDDLKRHDQGSASLVPKKSNTSNAVSKGKKKKKFAEINIEIIKEIENKQFEQSNNVEDPGDKLKKNLTTKGIQDIKKKSIIESINVQIKKGSINSKKK